MIDVTDATFEAEVLARSDEVPVVVDLWAPWCGPCRQLGPIIEKVVDATGGQVVLAKVDTDQNPQVAAAFRVQSIPAVFAVKGRKVVDSFVGAQPERMVAEFVERLLPSEAESEVDGLLAAGDEASLRTVLELEPANEAAIVGLAALLVDQAGADPGGADQGKIDEALALLEKVPESPQTRHIAALARAGADGVGDVEARLGGLLERVRDDDDARQEFVDLLELLGPDDPRVATWRRQLTSRLF